MSDYPDFSVVSLLKGFYAGEPKPLALDSNGYMIALLNGLFGGNPTGLQCDADGNIHINLKAQDLDEIINRGKYGAPDYTVSTVSVGPFATEELLSLTARGIIYVGVIYTTDSDWDSNDYILVDMDGSRVYEQQFSKIATFTGLSNNASPACFTIYDILTPRICIQLTQGWTFESQLTISYLHTAATTVDIYGYFYYATI